MPFFWNKSDHILTDSLSALHVLQQDFLSDTINLVTTILFKINQFKDQGKFLTCMWIPSHVGLQGNEVADKAAKDSLTHRHFNKIKISLSSLNSSQSNCQWNNQNSTPHLGTRRFPLSYMVQNCHWLFYITIPKSMPRREVVILHRYRLGYRCNWEIDIRVPKACDHRDVLV